MTPKPHDATTRVDVALGGERAYPVLLTDELPGEPVAAELARAVPRARRVLVVTDDHVAPLYADAVVAAIAATGREATALTLPHGEETKALGTIGEVVDAALARGILRGDALVALGGGVVGDITGFAAAILHRGVAFVQAPTTLLAQVDSSVGGKTGVNHATGKNLIGAFWQPRAVVASSRVLGTLPAREVRCGLAEALKHAFLEGEEAVRWCRDRVAALTTLEGDATRALVARCVRYKAAVVAADERDHGVRATLNLGHTFGHAFELLLGYGALTHGEAVALGLVLAARLSERLGVAAPGLEELVVDTLRAFGLPHDPDAADLPALPALIDAARGDKKAEGDGVAFILLHAPGRPEVKQLDFARIAALLGG
ncbi:MAG: 3-dehydroquinate synthase [Deltaproteobacteria bacterium]|nr:3-dehydroquinate synthase [Deltaproteobacteria bacterium]